MARTSVTFFALCCCGLIFAVVNCQNGGNYESDQEARLRPQIRSILNYLNSNSERIYDYKRATFVDAQKKQDDDVIDLTLDVEVDCIRREEPETACTTSVLTCEGSVRHVPETDSYETLSGVSCNPKINPQIPSADETQETAAASDEVSPENFYTHSPIELSHEVTSGSGSGEQFVAVRPNSPYCLGCPFDLNVNVEGISGLVDTALRHVETERTQKQALVRVLRIQQQIVVGVKYILLLEIAPTTCAKDVRAGDPLSCPVDFTYPAEICEVVYLERPWINKNKSVIGNNCTVGQQFASPAAKTSDNGAGNDLDNEIDVNGGYGKPAFPPEAAAAGVKPEQSVNFDKIAESGLMEDAMSPGRLAELESQILFKQPVEDPRIGPPSTPEAPLTSTPEYSAENAQEGVSTTISTLTDQEKGFLDEFLLNQEPPELADGSSEWGVKKIVKKDNSGASNLNDDDDDEDDADKRSSSSEEGGEKTAAGGSLNPRRKRYANGRRLKRGMKLGAPSSLPLDDPILATLLQNGIAHINQQLGGERRYQIGEVLSATSQVVAGKLYKIKVKLTPVDCGANELDCLKEERICDVRIWDQPWLPNGRETNITCEGDEKHYSFRTKRALPYYEDYVEDLRGKFDDFVENFGRKYGDEREYWRRFEVFKKNFKTIQQLNDNELGTASYGITKFADLTREEFSRFLGLRTDLRSENDIQFPRAKIPDVELPVEFDWREKNAVSEVKNQGQCGSCWAFSVTGNVEGQYAIKHGELLEFSEQELVDCDRSDDGCNGGLMDNAYRSIEKMGGLETESDYPYDAENEKCHFNKNLVRVQLSGAVNISGDETDMAKWLVKNGPISIAINANAMQFYVGGVSHPWKLLCSPKSLDHGVLIVGYGVHKYPMFNKVIPYWIVKNSWGKSWGERGYYRVYRGDGTCGLNQTPSSAIVV